jgi:hypothetical protein
LLFGVVTGAALEVHEIPSGLVIIEAAEPTATNKRSSLDQHTDCHAELAALVLVTHSTPLSLVITLLPVPEDATAQNLRRFFAQQTEFQELSAGLTELRQNFPSLLIIILFPVPELATAQNKFNSSDQQIEFQVKSTGVRTDRQINPVLNCGSPDQPFAIF